MSQPESTVLDTCKHPIAGFGLSRPLKHVDIGLQANQAGGVCASELGGWAFEWEGCAPAVLCQAPDTQTLLAGCCSPQFTHLIPCLPLPTTRSLSARSSLATALLPPALQFCSQPRHPMLCPLGEAQRCSAGGEAPGTRLQGLPSPGPSPSLGSAPHPASALCALTCLLLWPHSLLVHAVPDALQSLPAMPLPAPES